MDEHRALMGTVIEKVQFIKSGLTEACTSLLSGFEVSNVVVGRVSQYRHYPLMLCLVFGKKKAEQRIKKKYHRSLT